MWPKRYYLSGSGRNLVLPTIRWSSSWPLCLRLASPFRVMSMVLLATRVLSFRRLIGAFTGRGAFPLLSTSTLIVNLQPRRLLLCEGPEIQTHPEAFPIMPYTPRRMDKGCVVLQMTRSQLGHRLPSRCRVCPRSPTVLGRRQVLPRLLHNRALAKPLVWAHTKLTVTSSLVLVTPMKLRELRQWVAWSPVGVGGMGVVTALVHGTAALALGLRARPGVRPSS